MLRRLPLPLAALFSLAALAPSGARAEEEETAAHGPGSMATPPGPEMEDGPPRLEPEARGRRAVRGSSPDTDAEEDATRQALREFEESAFPRVAAGPREELRATGASVGRPVGREQVATELTSPRATPPRPILAGDGRPDLPWLSHLQTGDLPIRWDPRVIRYLEFYRDDPRGRAIMSAWLRDRERYRALIVEALARHGLPRDLLYVCMIESSYNAHTRSRVGAAGLWQFMPGGGRIYGLSMDGWVDERNDPEKSTEAAMLYFKDLHERFGNWPLALAAYNAGYGAVLKSIAKFNTNDFWALLDLEGGLPWESSVYVPKAMAAALVGHNVEAFGFSRDLDAAPFVFDRVTVDKSVTLSVIAAASGVDARAIAELNPELRRNRTPPGKTWAIRIPRGRKEQFARTFPQLRGDWDGFDAYVVRHGERVEDIARTYGLSTQKLRDLNGIETDFIVRGGTTIVVPRVASDLRAKNRTEAEADLYHSDVAPGGPEERMLVAVPDKKLRLPGRRRIFYRVVAGDDLPTVAAVFGLRTADIAEWNGLDRDARIQARMVLSLYVDDKFDAERAHVALLDESRLAVVTAGSEEHLDAVEARKGRRRVKIVAKKGDTLESIGRRYGLTKYDVARINRRGYGAPLAKGEEIVVYEVVDRVKARQAGVKAPDRPRGKAKSARGAGRAKPKSVPASKAIASKNKKK